MRVAETAGIAEAVRSAAPSLAVEEVRLCGPPTSVAIRAAGWAEAAIMLAALRVREMGAVVVGSPEGARAEARIGPEGRVSLKVSAGEVLDEVVLRSYCVGAAHMGLSWVRSEAICVDGTGIPQDLTIRSFGLTIRSFGLVKAPDMREVEVDIVRATSPPVRVSDAVFAATAAAAWIADGLPARWPTRRGS